MKTQNLITEEEYVIKYDNLLSSLLEKAERKNIETKVTQPSYHEEKSNSKMDDKDSRTSIFYYVRILIVCIILWVVLN